MNKIITLAVFTLVISCSPPPSIFSDKHVFFAGSIKEGKEMLDMYGWKVTKIDTIRDAGGRTFVFHYKETEIK